MPVSVSGTDYTLDLPGGQFQRELAFLLKQFEQDAFALSARETHVEDGFTAGEGSVFDGDQLA